MANKGERELTRLERVSLIDLKGRITSNLVRPHIAPQSQMFSLLHYQTQQHTRTAKIENELGA
jgi:hypothetical protein